jgi:hypothetical protein
MEADAVEQRRVRRRQRGRLHAQPRLHPPDQPESRALINVTREWRPVAGVDPSRGPFADCGGPRRPRAGTWGRCRGGGNAGTQSDCRTDRSTVCDPIPTMVICIRALDYCEAIQSSPGSSTLTSEPVFHPVQGGPNRSQGMKTPLLRKKEVRDSRDPAARI